MLVDELDGLELLDWLELLLELTLDGLLELTLELLD